MQKVEQGIQEIKQLKDEILKYTIENRHLGEQNRSLQQEIRKLNKQSIDSNDIQYQGKEIAHGKGSSTKSAKSKVDGE